ncbi:iron-containing alcohol dehydrogenase PsrA [Chitinimonas sp.]|uniref:iron-containing alcohol dehydrogenase PsrA n=1 Tax=Chitinimonas sp. TaxID=1934313 RepID=UPI0035AF9C08
MWHYYNPVSIYAGPGALAQLSSLLGQRRAIVLAFPEARSLGLVARIEALIGDRLLAVETDIQPNPDIRWLAPLYERLWREAGAAECIIAIGGGSTLDCAKAMLGADNDGRFASLLESLTQGAAFEPSRRRALIAIPTTAGTGSEVTPWATLWDQANGRKYSLHQRWTWPEAALIDAELMRSLPAGPTLASGLDALSHALEALWNIHRNPLSSSLAVSAARDILASLPALMAELDNTALRQQLALAALKAGLAFSNTRTALAHSLSYDITLSTGLAHGLACSFSLPRIMALAFGQDLELDQQLLRIFDARNPSEAVTRLSRFLEGLGVSTDPAHYGIAESDWSHRLSKALDGPRGRNFIAAGQTAACVNPQPAC